MAEVKRNYYLKNREAILAKLREKYADKVKDKAKRVKLTEEEMKERKKAYAVKYYEEHRDEILAKANKKYVPTGKMPTGRPRKQIQHAPEKNPQQNVEEAEEIKEIVPPLNGQEFAEHIIDMVKRNPEKYAYIIGNEIRKVE